MLAKSFLALGALVALAVPARAYTHHTLYTFCAEANCADGANPNGGLIQDALGNIFGTTVAGGNLSNTFGVAFELVANETRTAWTYKVLYKFCRGAGCPDGDEPHGGVILDASGNLYGTTFSGGAHGGGIVYKLSPGTEGDPWTLTILYSFCTPGDAACSGGYQPVGSLTYAGAASGAPYDGTSSLYGSASNDGLRHAGVVYALTVNRRGVWSERPLHNFCALADCADGANPQAGLTLDADGHLFGTTFEGGSRQHGVAFRLTHKRGDGLWPEKTLQTFCVPCGRNPSAAPALDAAGDVLGTTLYGGKDTQCPSKRGVPGAKICGVLYKLVRSGGHYDETLLHKFCSETDCADGRNPISGVLVDGEGNLFGATSGGGRGHNGIGAQIGGGVVYELSDAFHVLYDFCSEADCADGAAPSTPIIDTSGNLFGTAQGALASNPGTVYELMP